MMPKIEILISIVAIISLFTNRHLYRILRDILQFSPVTWTSLMYLISTDAAYRIWTSLWDSKVMRYRQQQFLKVRNDEFHLEMLYLELQIMSRSSGFIVFTVEMSQESLFAVILIALAIILDIIANISGPTNHLGLRAMFGGNLAPNVFYYFYQSSCKAYTASQLSQS